jgi:hypothetical protein
MISVGSPNQLGMFMCFSCDSIDDSMSGLKSNGCSCNLSGEAAMCDVMVTYGEWRCAWLTYVVGKG